VLRGSIGRRLRACSVILSALASLGAPAAAADCPVAGASLRVRLGAVDGAPPVTATVLGFVTAPSCDGDDSGLQPTYAQTLVCDPTAPAGCEVTFAGLRPGEWTHNIIVGAGESAGQFQGRRQLLLDQAAGRVTLDWPLHRSVHTVRTLDDAPNCTDCLRSAIAAANLGPTPALVQFEPSLRGTIGTATALPPITADHVTIDAFDSAGVPLTRTIDGNGLSAAAVRILGSECVVAGLRVTNVGGDSDAVLLDGAQANSNLLDTLEVIGRSTVVCGSNGGGCVVDGVCREPTAQNPRGVCGDDAIAVRGMAGAGGANHIRRSLISGARDKGVKVSDGGAAVVEDSTVFGNADGGLQATLSGQLVALRNLVIANLGTTSANGLAANGAAIGSDEPARLLTQGNLSIGNTLRGISVRSLSQATLRDDFVCGNTSGIALLDAAGTSPAATASGLAILRNRGSGVTVADGSTVSMGQPGAPGANAIAFNGPAAPRTPSNFRNQSGSPIVAIGNQWEHCGPLAPCDLSAVQALDIFTTSSQAPVAIAPAEPTRRRAAPQITSIEPTFASAGEVIRIYGSGFDAIGGIGTTCDGAAAVNTCRPLRGNCVMIDRVPTEVIAVTPTMLVARAPFTCVAPVRASVRTRWGHGFAHAAFCVVPDAGESSLRSDTFAPTG
jgi:hypothetical protein